MMLEEISSLVQKIIKRVRRSILLNKYNDFTIADYFRQQGARIGKNNRIEVRTLGDEPFLVSIANHCTIAPGVAFLNHDGGTWIFTDEIPSLQKFSKIQILDNCFIGFNTIIMGNTTIGPNSIVAAGSVVTKDVPPGTIVGGNPAKVISTVDRYKEKVIREWNKIKPEGYFEEISNGKKYSPEFIQEMKMRNLKQLNKHLEKVCWIENAE